MYQCCMNNLFAREPHVSYQDDILITESSDVEHLDYLNRILKKLSASGLRVRLDKYKSMAPSVTYLGRQIDLEGLHPTEEKIRAIRDAPALHNVTELKPFQGLFQFYSRYFPNVADKLSPLYLSVVEGCFLEVGNRSLFSVSTSERIITDEIVSLSTMIPRKELILTCDASRVRREEQFYPISYQMVDEKPSCLCFPECFSAADKNYSQLR